MGTVVPSVSIYTNDYNNNNNNSDVRASTARHGTAGESTGTRRRRGDRIPQIVPVDHLSPRKIAYGEA